MACKLPLETHSPKRDCNLMDFFFFLFHFCKLTCSPFRKHFPVSCITASIFVRVCAPPGGTCLPSDSGTRGGEVPESQISRVWGLWGSDCVFPGQIQLLSHLCSRPGWLAGKAPGQGPQVGLRALLSEALRGATPREAQLRHTHCLTDG